MRKSRIDATGAVYLIGVSATLGLNQVFIKLVNAGMEPSFQAGIRSVGAACLLLIYARVTGVRINFRDGSFWPGVLCGSFFAAEFLLLFYGLTLTSVARASVFFYTMPVWLALAAALLLGERLTGLRILGLVSAILGVAIAFLWEDGVTDGNLLGDLLCLAAAFLWMGIALLARASRLARAKPVMQLIYQLTVSAPLLLLASLIPGTFAFAMTPTLWSLVAVQIIGVGFAAYLLWFWLLSVYPASDMASFSFLAPMFGVLFGWLILGETLGPNILVAFVLVAIGLVLINRKPT